MKIGIVGHGFVGKALEAGFKHAHELFIYDKFKDTLSLKEVLEQSDTIFFCLPTPFNEETMHIDLSIYDEVIEEASNLVNNKLFVIKSTVVPETTKNYQEKYPNNNFAFNPEFLTEKNANEDFIHADRIVLGGNEDALSTLSHLYREVGIFSETKIVRMSTTEAEIVKYHANVELATRVLVSNVIYDVCEKTGANYNKVREGVITDKRIGPSHSIVPGPDGSRGMGGKCFVKDLAALIGKAKDLNVDHKILEEFFLYNLRIREDRDWEEIPGATSSGKKYDS